VLSGGLGKGHSATGFWWLGHTQLRGHGMGLANKVVVASKDQSRKAME
jgi:hypothetical protein